MILNTLNININYGEDNYLLFREGYKKLLPDLKNIVIHYLIKTPSNSNEICEFYHDEIVVKDLNGDPISGWPMQKIEECFNLAFKEDNYEIASLVVALDSINLNVNVEVGSDNWLHKAIIDKKNNFLNAVFDSKKMNSSLISKWPVQRIEQCFDLAFEKDDYKIASVVLALKKIDLEKLKFNFNNNKINWFHRGIIHLKKNFLRAFFELENLDINKRTQVNSILSLYADNQTPLHLAIEFKNDYALRMLLTHHKIGLLIRNRYQHRPYDFAIKESWGTEFFHKQFGEAHIFSKCADSLTLRLACERNETAIAIPLIYKLDINASYHDNLTLLFSCVRHRSNMFILHALVTHPRIKLNALNLCANSMCTALHLALEINNMPAFRLLIAHHNIDVNVNEEISDSRKENNHPISLLNTAINRRNIEAIELLINKKAPLIICPRMSQLSMDDKIRSKGEFIGIYDVEDPYKCYSPLELAQETKDKEIISIIEDYVCSVQREKKCKISL